MVVPHDADHPADPVSFHSLPKLTKEFLSAFKDKLSHRKKFRNFDPGGSSWYGLYSVLNASFSKHKVVFREMATGSIAAVVSTEELPTGETKIVLPDYKLFVIPCQSADEAHFVCGFFNSSIGDYLIRSYALATGISTHVFDRLPIPRFDPKNKLHGNISTEAKNCAKLARQEKDFGKDLDQLTTHVADLLKLSAAARSSIKKALTEIS